jgi:hydrogenase nickel incorporation protein HypA/HybF
VRAVHELSIAMSLVELACEEKEKRQLPRVQAVHLRLGLLSGVVREALVFSFDVASAGTSIEGAALRVEEMAGQELELFALEVAE